MTKRLERYVGDLFSIFDPAMHHTLAPRILFLGILSSHQQITWQFYFYKDSWWIILGPTRL
jgi:hypothetical protein